MKQRHSIHCAVYAYFIKDDQILLNLRQNTGWMDGYYGLPSGHLEKEESLKEALIREVQEEVGITVTETNLVLYHVMHRVDPISKMQYIDFFFKVEYWSGELINNEPEKSEHIKWFYMDRLPDKTVPNVKNAIEFYKGKLFFSEFV